MSPNQNPNPDITIATNPNSKVLKLPSKAYPDDFKIGALMSDGMWYAPEKIAKITGTPLKIVEEWLCQKVAVGEVEQSSTGAKTYRCPYESMKKWFTKNNYTPGEPVIHGIFPARIWDNTPEVDGFRNAPLREISTLTITAPPECIEECRERLRGVARIRYEGADKYRVFGLSVKYLKDIISPIVDKYGENYGVSTRSKTFRRELIDFSPIFCSSLVSFYVKFAHLLLRRTQETINMFIKEKEEQNGQAILWTIAAIERYNEESSVPFAGYFDQALRYWPYDLPQDALGKELAFFQRERSRAISNLTKEYGTKATFTSSQISEKMGISESKYTEMVGKHEFWVGVSNAENLVWEDSAAEKTPTPVASILNSSAPHVDVNLANKLSVAIVQAGIETGMFTDALKLIYQMDSVNTDPSMVLKLKDGFKEVLIKKLVEAGISNGQ